MPDEMAIRSSRFSGTFPSFIGCPFSKFRGLLREDETESLQRGEFPVLSVPR